MAIIVEEDRSSVNVIRLLAWVGTIAVIAFAGYYVFLAQPTPAIITPPPSYETIEPISSVTLQPSDVLTNPTYAALQQPPFSLPTPSGPAGVGRANPFVSP